MLGIGVFGAGGRVGQLLVELAKGSNAVRLESVYVRKDLDFSIDPGVLITKDLKVFLDSTDVIIDFTTAEGTNALLEVALKNPKPIVIGTTGLEEQHKNLIKEASKKMPILYASNMSLGVAVLNKAIKLVASTLRDFDIEIVETHHRHKKDSPSGTALHLAQTCAEARGLNLDSVRQSSRNGNIGERNKDEIGVMALRGGDVAGIHNVGFYGEGEHLEFIHTATSRATFAQGAIKAALWLQNQPNGLYGISDALGL
ncbi:4-hydroxy-tetrahydrodipicolinate reductase [Helicobacter sp.]|uniref:4-hydroxy-tetrahydrodipicolinate reductase n=1 Tax=Helicobacter sp. TaxID=218 RepID=UPI0025C0AEFB|nr:4-hydroxy-tetrahydrodipicolinate reductase [Helicobacter sp.]MCI5968970.1 4-hydroxy-tetrahydrodipicolinate reductase [Helicobacter sp.]MDY2584153.1 4-hydroxy-tetrahydrodipicolinate reductase [Helicobacter sp.]